MTLNVALHNPTTCRVSFFKSHGEDCACVAFAGEDGVEIKLFVSPAMADALTEAWDRAVMDAALDDEDTDDTPDFRALPEQTPEAAE